MIMYNVVKKDGRLEMFQPEKIVKCCIAAGVPEKEAKKVAEEVGRHLYMNIPTNEIRKMIIKKLGKIDKKAAAAYERYEKMMG